MQALRLRASGRRAPAENDTPLIHYVTTNGLGNAWVGNELRRVDAAGIPYVLHSMRRPGSTYFASEWATRLNASTRWIYPLPLSIVLSVVAAPFLFRSRFFGGLWNAMFGPRESLRARVAGLAHFVVACHWARGLGS